MNWMSCFLAEFGLFNLVTSLVLSTGLGFLEWFFSMILEVEPCLEEAGLTLILFTFK